MPCLVTPGPRLAWESLTPGGGFRTAGCVAGAGRSPSGGWSGCRAVVMAGDSLPQAGLGDGLSEHSAPVAVSILRLGGGSLYRALPSRGVKGRPKGFREPHLILPLKHGLSAAQTPTGTGPGQSLATPAIR